jgi:hypothetical protein
VYIHVNVVGGDTGLDELASKSQDVSADFSGDTHSSNDVR